MGPIGLIEYSEVLDSLLTYITNKCSNIDSFKPIPPDLVNANNILLAVNGSCAASGKVDNQFYKIVSKDKVKKELNAFLTTNGLADKQDQLITAKGLLNVYCAFGVFFSKKVIIQRSYQNDNLYCFYNEGDIVFSPPLFELPNKKITADDINALYNSLCESLTNSSVSQIHKLILSYSCSCSCSSSSSSSCSSSCSSSSSSSCCLFIAYMMV